MSITLTHVAQYQAECPDCQSKMTYVWDDTVAVMSDGVRERRIVCPLCSAEIKHHPVNKTGYMPPPDPALTAMIRDGIRSQENKYQPNDGHPFTQVGQTSTREMADGFCSACGGYRHEHKKET